MPDLQCKYSKIKNGNIRENINGEVYCNSSLLAQSSKGKFPCCSGDYLKCKFFPEEERKEILKLVEGESIFDL